MERRVVIAYLAGATVASTLVWPVAAEAQQAQKVPRIGHVTISSLSSNAARNAAFERALRELGYVPGKNIVIEWRSAEGKFSRLPAILAELLRLEVDLIVSGGASVTRAAKHATSTVPIIMRQDPDPVGNGFVASLARPGGNITGVSSLTADLSRKRLELLKEIVPGLSRVAVLGTSTNASNAQQIKETKLAADAIGVQIHFLDVLRPGDIESAFLAADDRRAEAFLMLFGPILRPHRRRVTELAIKSQRPAVYPFSVFVEAGGLMSYGTSLLHLEHRAAIYVDKILKGAKPADLPIETPTKFELVVNLKTAKRLGITIPSSILLRADEVIE